ncbi:hypothetical protein Syun_023379 [Stephania yunnanensis]|uniref:Phytocyanin domain-containing protein n=1 Tax=Stephania yunnanensis TaxID=152371 RepID=A0AAP0HZJ4_9MAGN
MESLLILRRPLFLLLTCAAALLLAMPSGTYATRFIVGGHNGWTNNFNYTEWAKTQHFYLGDWLCLKWDIFRALFDGFVRLVEFMSSVFVYDRNQMNVLEVNKTAYDACSAEHPLHNWTTGAGRDVVPLNVTRHFYFISGNGFCYGGMKLAVRVENLPPPPKAALASHKNGAPNASSLIMVRLATAFAVMWALLFRI